MKKNKTRRPYVMPCPVRDILYAGAKQNATGNPDTGYLQINEQVYLPEWLDRFQQEWKNGSI